MKAIKDTWRNLPLRRFFILTVAITIVAASLLSALIISGCIAFRRWLLPDSNAAYLTIEETSEGGESTTKTYRLEYGQRLSSMPSIIVDENGDPMTTEGEKQTRFSIQKVENSFDMLSPKRKFAYQVCGAMMVAAPAALAFAGICACSIYFYRRKMRRPLGLLFDAAEKIARQDLDFVLAYDCNDEMGALCHSFEDMRKALHDNNKEMWQMLEERRLLQASVAHDLRNPIAIIKGYAEYLDAGFANGTLGREKAAHIVQNLNMATRRLEQYTESVRLINQSEMDELRVELVFAKALAEDVIQDMRLLAEQKNIALRITNALPQEEVQVDVALLYRILENVMGNALRFARKEIHLEFALENHIFSITVTDDGRGFLPEVLEGRNESLIIPGIDGHMGIGIAISKLLCKKHGGRLELANMPDGASVKISLTV